MPEMTFAEVKARYGILLSDDVLLADDPVVQKLAMDAQPHMTQVANGAIPSFLVTTMSPKVIEQIVSPMRATEMLGGEDRQIGTWTDMIASFQVTSEQGSTTGYGDFNNFGTVGVNNGYVQREAYRFQVIAKYGDLETELYDLTGLRYKERQDKAAANILNRTANRVGFFGVDGIRIRGLLNDINLPAAIGPAMKASGSSGWARGTPNEILADILTLFAQLQTQTLGLVTFESKLRLNMSPQASTYLLVRNIYNVQAMESITQTFKNLSINTANEYGVAGGAAGETIQMIAEELNGNEVGYTAFSTKLKPFQPVREASATIQKFAQSTYGAIIEQPLGVATMFGV